MSMREIRQLEAKIKGKMKAIKEGTLTKAESNLGMFFKRLKQLDEASHEKLLSQYAQIEDVKKDE